MSAASTRTSCIQVVNGSVSVALYNAMLRRTFSRRCRKLIAVTMLVRWELLEGSFGGQLCEECLYQKLLTSGHPLAFFKSVDNLDVFVHFNTYSVSQKIPPEVFWYFFANGWESLVQILHTYYTFLSMLEYKFLFNYLQLWRSYAILSAATQRIFTFH